MDSGEGEQRKPGQLSLAGGFRPKSQARGSSRTQGDHHTAMFEGAPTETDMTQSVSKRTFKILSERWHSDSHCHNTRFSEMLPTKNIDVEVSIYPNGAEAGSENVGVHIDYGGNDMARGSDGSQVAAEHAWRLLSRNMMDPSDFNPFETRTYRCSHLSDYDGQWLGETLKCSDVDERYVSKGVITLQLWSRYTMTTVRAFQSTEGIKSASLNNLLIYNDKMKLGMDVGAGSLVTLWAGEESVIVRKDILLASSDALLAHFLHDTAQRQQNAIHVGDTTIGALVGFVEFIEEAECPVLSLDDLHHLGELSIRWLIPALTKTVEWMYSMRINFENASSILLNVVKLDLNLDCRDQVCEFIKENVDRVSKEPGWANLLEHCGAVVTDMMIELQQENSDLKKV